MLPVLFASVAPGGFAIWIGLTGCLLVGMFVMGVTIGAEARLPRERLHLKRQIERASR